jgi:hypothetical protein
MTRFQLYTKQLQTQYRNACNAYLFAFCQKHEFEYDENAWVANRPGEVACVADYFVDMQTIVDDIDLDAPEDVFFEWYDYTLELGSMGVQGLPNFRSWVKGCPRKSEQEIQEIRDLHQRVEDAKTQLEELINNKK